MAPAERVKDRGADKQDGVMRYQPYEPAGNAAYKRIRTLPAARDRLEHPERRSAELAIPENGVDDVERRGDGPADKYAGNGSMS
jgi:hypothetical protein